MDYCTNSRASQMASLPLNRNGISPTNLEMMLKEKPWDSLTLQSTSTGTEPNTSKFRRKSQKLPALVAEISRLLFKECNSQIFHFPGSRKSQIILGIPWKCPANPVKLFTLGKFTEKSEISSEIPEANPMCKVSHPANCPFSNPKMTSESCDKSLSIRD